MHLRKYARAARSGFAPELEDASFIEKNAKLDPTETVFENVTQSLYFPIVVQRSAAEESKVWTSNCWNAVSNGSNLAFAVKTAILFAGDENIGFDSVIPDREAAPQQYRSAVISYAKNTMGRLTRKESTEFQKQVRKTKMMDWELYLDVKRAMTIIGTKKGRGDQLVEDIFGVQDGDANAAHPADALSRRLEQWRGALRRNSGRSEYGVFGRGIWFQTAVPGAGGICPVEELRRQRPAYLEDQDNVPLLPLGAEHQEELEADRQGEAADDQEPQQQGPIPEELQHLMNRAESPKVYFTLTSMPLSEKQSADTKLYMVRLCVVDPTLDIRRWHADLLQYVKVQNVHVSAVMNGGAAKRSNFPFRYPNHDVVADCDDPAFSMTDSRYLQCAAEFHNDASILSSSGILTNNDLFRKDSKLNILNVFSFKNCARILTKAGADAQYLESPLRWLDAERKATFPPELTTFLYPPETVFWVDRNKLGLMEQMFPQRNSNTELYAAIFKGVGIEEMICEELTRRRALTGEHDPQLYLRDISLDGRERVRQHERDLLDLESIQRRECYDEMTEREREALNARVMRREDIKGARQVNYETENRFVHFALERDVLYANLGRFYPSNAMDILEQCKPYIQRHRNFWLTQLRAEDYQEYSEIVKRAGHQLEHDAEAWVSHVVNAKQRKRMLDAFRKHRSRWKVDVLENDRQLYEDVERYEKYRLVHSIVQNGCMDRFSQFWRLDGRIENLPISDGCKAVLRFGHGILSKSDDRIITRTLVRKDPDLSFFATSLTKNMVIFARIARIVQPKVQMLAEGLLSCFDYHPGEINFHILVHGRYDLGKTYQLLTTMINFSSIEGRVIEETRFTDASKDSGDHTYDITLAKDEIPDWITSSKAQEKNVEMANQMKQRMTRKQAHLTAFESVAMPDGSMKRGTRHYVTDDYSSMACVTNNEVEPTGPLTSRFFCLVMKDVGVSVLETMYEVPKAVKANGQEWIRLIEYHSAAAKKAAMCGAIMKDVNMDLWQDVCNRMIQYLEDNGLIPKDKGYRPMQIMVPFLRQYVYHRAAMLTWNIPGAPFYNKPYDVSQLQTMQRFLYVDLQTILFVWTLLGSQYVNGDNAEVLSAAVKLSGIRDWSDGMSAYDLYVNKRGQKMPFRRVLNTAFVAEEKRLRQMMLGGDPLGGGGGGGGGDDADAEPRNKRDKYLLDLNYVTIEGTSFMSICQMVAAKTSNTHKIAAVDVKGILETLAKGDPMQPPRNGYQLQPQGTFEQKHCTRRQPTGVWTKVSFLEDDENGVRRERVYEEDDIPPLKPLEETMSMAPVMIERPERTNGKWRVHVAPWAIERFREQIIVEAFNNVVMTPSHPRKKFLVGWTYPNDPSVFQVMNYARDGAVERLCQHYAAQETRPSGYTRMDGVVFARHQYNTPSELIELQEQLEGCDFKQPDKPYALVKDLEYYSAASQHVLSGRPLDAPVECPKQIEARYERACSELKIQASRKNYSYPVNNLNESRNKKNKVQSVTGSGAGKRKATARERAITQRICEEELSMDSLLNQQEEDEETPTRLSDRARGKQDEDEGGYVIEGESLLDADTAISTPSLPRQQKRLRRSADQRAALLESLTNDF